jgi:hypothetical protein
MKRICYRLQKVINAGIAQMQYMNPPTQWGLRLRNAIFRIVTSLKLDLIAMTVASWLRFTERKVPMPDYAWPASGGLEKAE